MIPRWLRAALCFLMTAMLVTVMIGCKSDDDDDDDEDREKSRSAHRKDRTISQNNLKQIGVGFFNYEGDHGHFPQQTGLQTRGGSSGLSWRVWILPYVEEMQLYQQFKLDEPWDSPRNKALISKMPKLYALPGSDDEKNHTTHYQVFVGPKAPYDPNLRDTQGLVRPRIQLFFQDGTSNTILVAEAAEPVIWTKPEDLPFSELGPLPKLGEHYGRYKGFNVLLADGFVRFAPSDIEEETLRLLIMPADGQIAPNDW